MDLKVKRDITDILSFDWFHMLWAVGNTRRDILVTPHLVYTQALGMSHRQSAYRYLYTAIREFVCDFSR